MEDNKNSSVVSIIVKIVVGILTFGIGIIAGWFGKKSQVDKIVQTNKAKAEEVAAPEPSQAPEATVE